MPIYTEGTQPYNAPLSSPVGLEPYGEILALRKMMENGENALHDAEQAAATVGSAVTAANQAASDANSAASSARSAAAVASEKASAADTAATQASDAASDANFNAAWARSEANNARSAAQSANTAATAAGSAASDARQAATSATQAATAANRAVAAAQAATGQAADALTAANAANATATASIALAESAASDANTAAADARSATANAVTATSHANVATANANAATDAANRAANVAAAAANNANAKAADARRAADLANTAAAAANRATSDASGAADDASAAATAANSAATAANSAATAASSAATAAGSAATTASSAATTASEAASTATSAANSATTAASNANAAASRVDAAISSANSAAAAASAAATDAEDRIEAAIEAAGDISELAVPLMSADTRGGAKLGDGLAVDDGTLHVGQLAKASTGEVYGPLASVTAKGHAEQASTTGKNLLPNNATSTTLNGVTFTVNADDSISISGTASSNFGYNIYRGLSLDSGTYTLSTGTTLPYGSTFAIETSDGNKSTTNQTTFTASVSGLCWIQINSGVTVNTTVYPQLELGSTATPYEPYTGGAPSPSPDYPQEIQVVRGRNLLDESMWINDGRLPSVTDGTFVSTSVSHRSPLIPVKAGNYVFAMTNGYANGSKYVHGYDSNGTWVSNLVAISISEIGRTVYIPFTVSSDISFVCLTNQIADSNSQLTLGSTPQPYVPYGHVGLEVQGRKNLLDERKSEINKALDSSGNLITWNGYRVSDYIPVKPNTDYYLSKVVGSSISYTSAIYDSSKTFLRTALISGSTTTSGSINTGNNAAYVRVTYHQTADGSVQVERGSTGTEYENYTVVTPIPLPQRGWVGGLPDGTADILSIDSAGKVEWEIPVGEYIVTGNEATSGVTDLGTNIRVPLANVISQHPSASATRGFCTHATFANDYVGDYIHAYTANATVYLFGAYETASEVLAAYTDAEILYPLATPVTEDCGYVDLPDIPSEATVSIPELEELGLTFWVDGDGTIRAAMREWYERAHSEYADRLTALEEAVAEIVAGA